MLVVGSDINEDTCDWWFIDTSNNEALSIALQVIVFWIQGLKGCTR